MAQNSRSKCQSAAASRQSRRLDGQDKTDGLVADSGHQALATLPVDTVARNTEIVVDHLDAGKTRAAGMGDKFMLQPPPLDIVADLEIARLPDVDNRRA